jgi:magnesium transporter
MVTGFLRLQEGSIVPVTDVDVAAEEAGREGTVLWLDLEEPTDEDVFAVGQAFELDAEALEDCVHGEQRPRVDEFDRYIFLVLYAAVGPDGSAEFAPRKLAAFLGPNLLITVHRTPLRSVSAMLERCRKSGSQVLGRGPDFLLYNIIDAMVDNYVLVADAYETQLEELEELSLDPAVDETLLTKSASLRRELLELRRLATSQRELLTPLAKGEYEHVSEALEQRFSHVEDHLMHATELIDALRDRLNAVHDNYHTALTDRTNAIIKMLTLFATIMLPLTLVAGIYGMNLPLWPSPGHPATFWAVLGGMVAITGVILYYFRRRHWL